MDRTHKIVLHVVLAVVASTVLFAALAVPFTLHTLAVAKYRSGDGYGMMDRYDRFDRGKMGRGQGPRGGCGVQEEAPRNSACPGFDDESYDY